MANRQPRRCSQNRDAEDADASVFDLSSSSGQVARRARNVVCPASTSLGSWNHVPTDGGAADRRSVGSGSTSRSQLAELRNYERELEQRAQLLDARASELNEYARWQESRIQNVSQVPTFPVSSSSPPSVVTGWDG